MSPSSPSPTNLTPDRASPQQMTPSATPRRVSPLADLGALISKSQLNRRISQQPSPPLHQQSTRLEGQDTKKSAAQSKTRRATADPAFLSKFVPPQPYGESNSTSDIFNSYSGTKTSTSTISAPVRSHPQTPIPIPRPTEPSTPALILRQQASQPVDPSAFIPPLTLLHFQCYQSHRSMKRSSNIHAPVPCMTCRVDDTEMRWKCTWCCLRICGACMQKLEKVPGKDLGSMVQRLGRGRRRSQGY
ncbi:MAG: hypothetical protein FRX48_00283 [Lasallia pustulata]|nr:MAG: hypothetical protein FRX48_00283 [Lasallia pustulata]